MPRDDLSPTMVGRVVAPATFPLYLATLDFSTPLRYSSGGVDIANTEPAPVTWSGVGMVVSGFDHGALIGRPMITLPNTGNALSAIVAAEGLKQRVRVWMYYQAAPGETSFDNADRILLFDGILASASVVNGAIIRFECTRKHDVRLVPFTRCQRPTNNYNVSPGTTVRWGTGEITVI